MLDRLGHVQRQLGLVELRLVNDPGGKNITDRLASEFAAWEAAVHDLIGLASQRRPDTDVLSVRELVNGAQTALTHQLAQRAVHVVVDVPEETRTTGDQQLLQRAIINLVLEALDQAPRGTELLVAATEGLQTTEVEIACDPPPGSDPYPAPSERDESATALRWAAVHRIAQQHGGEAVAKEGGARYVLRIPHAQAGVQPSG
jgi:signal transduction histidine kinase